mgnify:CR=1 FL=1
MNRTDVWPILSSALDIASAYRGRKFNKPRKNITRARAQLITAGAPHGITNAFTPRRKN